jgi:hypothetical protein
MKTLAVIDAEKGFVSMRLLRFYLDDLVDRFQRPDIYPYARPTTVRNFADCLVEILKRCDAIERADDIVVLETPDAPDVQDRDAWRRIATLKDAAELIAVRGETVRFRRVAKDEQPPPNCLWFVQDWEPARGLHVSRWRTGRLDSHGD